MSLEKGKLHEGAKKRGGLSGKTKMLIGGIALSASALLTGCGNGVPEANQAEYKMGKEVLVSKSNGFEFYKWEPKGAPRQLFLVKYNPESQNNGEKVSKKAPKKIGENNGLELYEWEADGAGHDLYIVKGKDVITTNWNEYKSMGKTGYYKDYSVTYNQGGEKTETKTKKINTLETWLKLSPEEQESLGLPRSDNPRIKTLVGLSEEQRASLGLTEEYNQLLKQIKK